jgi:hypothetical protein
MADQLGLGPVDRRVQIGTGFRDCIEAVGRNLPDVLVVRADRSPPLSASEDFHHA